MKANNNFTQCCICYEAPCKNACPNNVECDTIIKNLKFSNDDLAKNYIYSDIACINCEGFCQKKCPKNINIKKIICENSEKIKNTNKIKIDNYDLLKTDLCGIKMESPFLLSSSIVSADYEKAIKNRLAEEYELFVKADYNYEDTNANKYYQLCENPNI